MTIRYRIAVFTALVTIAGSLAAVGASPAEATQQTVKDSWIVTLKQGEDPEQSRSMARQRGGSARFVYRNAMAGFNFRGSAEQARRLAQDRRVLAVEPDRVVSVDADSLPWGIMRVDAWHNTDLDAYEAGYRGDGVRVAILDTGIDLDHPDLKVSSSLGKNCSSSSTLDDRHGHGTHVAGTVAALYNGSGVIGVGPNAAVVPVKVLNDSGSGSDATIMCGVDHLTALKNDFSSSNDVLVGNMSLSGIGSSGSCSSGLRRSICNATAAGIVFTAAAGNDNKDARSYFPANYPEVITTSAICDSNGKPGDDYHASFSNWGSIVDVTAPGCSVYSTYKDGRYATMSGTSMAAPHAAGVAALVKQQQPSMKPADVEAVLKDTGECPNGTKNLDGGTCSGQGKWSGDDDGVPEPSVNALFAAQQAAGASSGGGTVENTAPSVSWSKPSNGQTVSGTVAIEIKASDTEDAAGTLKVEWKVNSEAWRTASYNASAGAYTSSWDSTKASDGTNALETRATDSGGKASTSSISVTVSNGSDGGDGGSTSSATFDFEGGLGSWTTNGLWHHVNGGVCGSSTKSVYFGRDASCTYDTGSRVNGVLESPTIAGLPSSASLSFSHFRQVESTGRAYYDMTYVQVSYDGGSSWQMVWFKDGRNPSENAWTTVSAALAPANGTVKLRFVFESLDASYNNYRGWLIDNVAVQ